MAHEAQIETAKTHFGKILEEQLARVERLKRQPDWLDFSQIKPIKIGMIGGDGIGPTIAIESQRVLEYLLRDQVQSGKVEFRTIEGRMQRDLLQNIGVIPNEGTVAVKFKGRTIGSIEEIFVRQLQIGDVFIMAGRPVRLERAGMMECWVARADSAVPTVPR